MDTREADLRRRQFLTMATASVGGVGLVTASLPFVHSMSPSEAAKAAGAPVEVNVSQVEPGALLTAEWRGRPVWIVHRTGQMLEVLGKYDDQLVDPQSRVPQQPAYAQNAVRSIKPQYLVVVGICTHLGCIPSYRPQVAPADSGPDWPGGFYCPCHGSKFDLAGRVFKNVPAPSNLEVPPHRYVDEMHLLVGEDNKPV